MTKQKDVLVQLEELQKRIGLMVKQYNDLARSESLDARLVFGSSYPYENDDDGKPREIDAFYDASENNDSWSNSSGCSWQSSSTDC